MFLVDLFTRLVRGPQFPELFEDALGKPEALHNFLASELEGGGGEGGGGACGVRTTHDTWGSPGLPGEALSPFAFSPVFHPTN